MQQLVTRCGACHCATRHTVDADLVTAGRTVSVNSRRLHNTCQEATSDPTKHDAWPPHACVCSRVMSGSPTCHVGPHLLRHHEEVVDHVLRLTSKLCTQLRVLHTVGGGVTRPKGRGGWLHGTLGHAS
jgi:hypothetical protein